MHSLLIFMLCFVGIELLIILLFWASKIVEDHHYWKAHRPMTPEELQAAKKDKSSIYYLREEQ